MSNVKFQQGCILTNEDSHKLGLVESLCSPKRVIIISHDCDLANHSEEFIECIIGQLIDKPDPNYRHARHPRRLHLHFNSNNQFFYIELNHSNKQSIKQD